MGPDLIVGVFDDNATSCASRLSRAGIGVSAPRRILRNAFIVVAAGTSSSPAAGPEATSLIPAEVSTRGCSAASTRDGPEADLKAIRAVSGLTWSQIATVFGVERRTVHLWAAGAGISERNERNLAKVAAYLRRLARDGDGEALRRRLVGARGAVGSALSSLLEKAGGERAPGTTIRPMRKPSAAAIRRAEAMHKRRPSLFDQLNTTYDFAPQSEVLRASDRPRDDKTD